MVMTFLRIFQNNILSFYLIFFPLDNFSQIFIIAMIILLMLTPCGANIVIVIIITVKTYYQLS